MAASDSGRKAKRRERPPLLEWISGAIGLAVAAGTLTYLGWQAASQSDALPALSAEIARIVGGPDGYTVEVTVRNSSPASAAEVQIEGSLRADGRAVRSTATIDYVPGGSTRRAGLLFAAQPNEDNLEVRVIGYREP